MARPPVTFLDKKFNNEQPLIISRPLVSRRDFLCYASMGFRRRIIKLLNDIFTQHLMAYTLVMQWHYFVRKSTKHLFSTKYSWHIGLGIFAVKNAIPLRIKNSRKMGHLGVRDKAFSLCERAVPVLLMRRLICVQVLQSLRFLVSLSAPLLLPLHLCEHHAAFFNPIRQQRPPEKCSAENRSTFHFLVSRSEKPSSQTLCALFLFSL